MTFSVASVWLQHRNVVRDLQPVEIPSILPMRFDPGRFFFVWIIGESHPVTMTAFDAKFICRSGSGTDSIGNGDIFIKRPIKIHLTHLDFPIYKVSTPSSGRRM
ncbi:hypothetical protein [Burkholderia ubonensis]|uniref:hypothetical protein n=1 Tax=Burkholderia ubonensis TaxID=101571 RepID=UPI0012FAA051|nr:hypothetical protein [Burkholderia ubonensis]